MDVELTLYPRVALAHVGLAPLTSMFFFGPHDRQGIDDFRSSVHDSEGLAIWNGREEWLWRPLINPDTLQTSVFLDANPRGFGLVQRRRAFTDYQDLEARYERRPSLWVEPIGIGAKVRCSWWRFPPSLSLTTTLWPSGIRNTLSRLTWNTAARIVCTGAGRHPWSPRRRSRQRRERALGRSQYPALHH